MGEGMKVQTSLISEIKVVLINYFKTQLVLMLIVTALVWGVLSLLGVKYSVILAFGTGSLSVVPVFGITIASIIVSLIAIFDQVVFLPNLPAFVEGLVILLIFFILNKLVDFLLTPIILGKTNEINPIVLILIVFLSTIVFGVFGAFFAIPALLIIKTIWKNLRK
jgi:predicted PurR-regulated permease PerM